MSSNPNFRPLDFADIIVLLTRFRTLEKCQFNINKLSLTSSAVASSISSSDDPLMCIATEIEELSSINKSMETLRESDRKALQERLPLIFGSDGELTDVGCDIILVFLYLTQGSVLAIAETMTMLYSIEVQDIDMTEQSMKESSTFLKPYLSYFADRFIDKDSSGIKGFRLTEEADDRIEAVITQLKQSPRSFGGLESLGGSSKPTVH